MALPGGHRCNIYLINIEKVYIAANNIISIINKKNKNIMLVYTVAIQKKNLSNK